MDKYYFHSAKQECKTYDGKDYVLNGKCYLTKLPRSIRHPFKSFYVNLRDGEIIDCTGYIEDRCLRKIG